MDSSPSVDLIAAYCDHQRIRGRSKRTIESRRWLLTKADRELPYGLDQATDDEIKTWLYRDDLTPNAKASYYDALNTFYAYWLSRPGGFPFNPMDDLPRPQERRGRPRPLTHDQLRRILTEAAQPYQLWMLLAAYLGARCVEISRLDRDDVGAEVTYLHGKGDRERVVATHPDVHTAVAALDPGPVARTRQGTRANPHYVTNMASAYFGEVMGMRGVALHRGRHWYATYVQRAAGDIRITQESLGHAAPSTTALYTLVDFEAMRAAVCSLPRLSVVAAGEGGADAGQVVGRPSPLPISAPGPAAGRRGREPR